MIAATTRKFGPVDVEIIREKGGQERLLIAGVDVAPIVTDYEIISHPHDIKRLRITIPVASLSARNE